GRGARRDRALGDARRGARGGAGKGGHHAGVDRVCRERAAGRRGATRARRHDASGMSEPSGMRWWIPPPAPDETLRSVLERAAALYRWEPGELWRALNGQGARDAGTIDTPSSKGLMLLGRALGLPAR